MSKFIYSPIFVFIIGLANSLIIHFIGDISGSFLLFVITIPFWLSEINRNDKIVKWAFKIFLCLLLVQIFTECFHEQNTSISKFKGIAVTITGLVHFFVFYTIFKKNIDVIKWYVFGLFVSPFLFPSTFMEELNVGYTEEDVTYFKFIVVPTITEIFMLLVLFVKNIVWHKFLAYLMLYTGGLCLLLGARSGGLTLFITGVSFLYLSRHNNIQLRKLKRNIFVIATVILIIYECLYVPFVLSGDINAGNTSQLLRSTNPYNPIEILKIGRTDALIPFYAFMDRPLIGWGYLALDPKGKYATMLFEMSNGEEHEFAKVMEHYIYIPGHSVIFYYACAFGIVALICVFLLWYKTLRLTFYSLLSNDSYKLYRLSCLINVTWHLFFSPMPHFKYLPASIAFLIVSSQYALCKDKASTTN